MDESKFVETMAIRYEPRTDALLREAALTDDEYRALCQIIGQLIGDAWQRGFKVIIDYKV